MESTEDTMSYTENSVQHKLFEYVTITTHIFTAGFVLIILYLCLTNELVFFTWHPTLASVGWVFLMTEGILMLIPSNRLIKGLLLSHKQKVRYHWIIQTIGISLSVIAFGVIYINKNIKEKPHFHSWHAIAGLISVICCIPTCITGVIALYSFTLKNHIKPVNSKFTHRICGIIIFLIGATTVLLSLYTKWFQRNVNGLVTITWFMIILFITFWTLSQACIKVFSRLRSIFLQKNEL